MHEMALAEGVLGVVLQAGDGQLVRRVSLRVGTLLMVVPDSFSFSFELAAQGSVAEGAILDIAETPARLRCKQCQSSSVFERPPYICTQCGSVDMEVESGDELIVEAVELHDGRIIRQREVPASELLAEHMKEHAADDHEFRSPHVAPPTER